MKEGFIALDVQERIRPRPCHMKPSKIPNCRTIDEINADYLIDSVSEVPWYGMSRGSLASSLFEQELVAVTLTALEWLLSLYVTRVCST
jgi:hypothetical protein